MQVLLFILLIFLTLLFLFLFANLLAISFYFYAMFRGAFFAPSRPEYVKTMIRLLKSQLHSKSEKTHLLKIADLGSGDGRVLIALAKAGFEAHGFEINPLLVLRSHWNIQRQLPRELHQHAFVHWQDFWNVNFHFDAITVYGIGWIMKRLEKKFLAETKPGTILVSNAFTFPNLKPIKKEGVVLVYKH